MKMTERLEAQLLELDGVYADLEKSSQKLFEASELSLKAKHKLEIERLIGLANGSIFGKNADEREACAREVIGGLFVTYGKTQDDERIAKHEFDLAFMKVEMSRTRLRIMELLCKVTDNG